jgi:hypothetical protein
MLRAILHTDAMVNMQASLRSGELFHHAELAEHAGDFTSFKGLKWCTGDGAR